MKSILVISGVFPPEPVVSGTVAYDLATALSENRRVRVLTPRPSRPHGFTFPDSYHARCGFEHIILNSYACSRSSLPGRIRESYSFGRISAAYILENRADIDCVYFNAWPLLAQYLIVSAAKKCAIPSVVHVQDIYPESLSKKIPLLGGIANALLRPIDRFVLKNATAVAAISTGMKNTLVRTRRIPPEKVHVIQNWQDEGPFIRYQGQREAPADSKAALAPFTFMYLGNIGPVANVDMLIKAFAGAELSGSRLVIAGSGSQKETCKALASRYSSVPIEFWDVPSGRVPEIQHRADVLLLPLRPGAAFSSIPSKLIAYMYSSKPVIACADADSDTAAGVREAECGWVIPPADIHRLEEAMQLARSLPGDALQEFGRNGFNYAIRHYSKAANLPQLLGMVLAASSFAGVESESVAPGI